MNKIKNLLKKLFKIILSLEGTIFVLSVIFLLSIYDLLNKFWFGISVFLVFSGYFFITSYLRTKKIHSALNLIEKKLYKFGEGDFNVLLYSSKEEEEILKRVNEDLLRITNKFESIVANLRGIASNIKENSYRIDDQLVIYIYDAKNHLESIEQTKRLSEEIRSLIGKIHQDAASLSKNTDKTVKFLENISNQNEDIRITAESLSMYIYDNKEAMEQIQKNTRKVTENTENLSSLSLETFSAITEMESTFKEISKYIDYTQSLTREIIKISKFGMQQSRETLISVEKVGEVLSTFILKINMLKEQSLKIERIVDAISRIGERTNLLALNATIFSQSKEGKAQDFEIITDKIMELSESSTIALKEISQLIVQFENVILELTQLGKEGSQAMEKALKNMYQTTENFSDISNRLNEIGHHFYNIATASNEHSLGTQQIRDAAHQISDLSEDIANLMSAEDKIVTYVSTKTAFMSEIIDNMSKSLDVQAEKVQELLGELKEVENSTRRMQRESEELKLNNSISIDSISKVEEGFKKNFKNILTMSNTSLSLKKYGEYLSETIDFFRLPHRFQGGTLRVGGISIPYRTLDPAFADTIAESQVLDLIYSGLVRYNYLTNIVPDLCTHWEISDDGLRYTFYLRKDVMFHNGQVFTALDVLATFKRLLDKDVNSHKAGLFFTIKGAKAFHEGATEVLEGLKVLDDYTVQFILEKPLVFFLDLLTLSPAKIIPQAEYHRKKTHISLIGTGPFKVELFNPDEKIVLKKNETYYIHNRPFLDRVIFDLSEEGNKNAVEKFKGGEVDFVFAGDEGYVKQLNEDIELKNMIETIPQVSTYFLAFNCTKKPFDNPRVRLAFNLAIDRFEIVNSLPRDYAIPAFSIVPNGVFTYVSNVVSFNYNPEEAIRILKEEDFDFENFIFELTFRKRSNDIQDDILAIKESLEKINIKVKLNGLSKHWEYIAKKEFHAFRVGWVADYPDADNFIYTIFNSNAGDPFHMSYKNKMVDVLSEEARYEIEPRTRAKLYAKIEQIILEDSPVIPLYHRKNIVLKDQNLQGVKLKGFSPQVDFSEISFRTFN